jgi:hypothetical protein
MTEKLRQIIKEEMQKLPKENQQAISAFDWAKMVEDIGKKYLFDENEINDLQIETFLILIGVEEFDSYSRNIENEVGTSREEASKITEEVLKKIFIPINDLLVENIKKSEKVKDPKWNQNLDFILSGGNYSSFLNPVVPKNSPLEEYPLGGGGNVSTPSRERATPQEGNKTTNIEIRPEEITQ